MLRRPSEALQGVLLGGGGVSMRGQGLGTAGQKDRLKVTSPQQESSQGQGRWLKGRRTTEDLKRLGTVFPEKCPQRTPGMNTNTILYPGWGVLDSPKPSQHPRLRTPHLTSPELGRKQERATDRVHEHLEAEKE